ncbi:uncharacterized protein LOC143275310 isoform X2 [Babylonia areolata]|uniref:uncharacterized protein LOC143275310 isoform X2 n=1 Tax=Babylonia areolata TaxID=304850 RepID=UPI003FCF89E4
METFSQLSACGCGHRKHPTVPLTTKYQNQFHQRRQSVRSLALRPVAADAAQAEENSGSISLASLHIQALRPPENSASIITAGTEDEKSPRLGDYDAAWQGNGSDYTYGTRSAVVGKISAATADKINGVITESHASILKPKPRGSLKSAGHERESLKDRATSRHKDTPSYASHGSSSQNHSTAPSNKTHDYVTGARATHETDPRDLRENLVTHGEFISRRPPPAFRSKSVLRQQQQQQRQQRVGRERCRSGVTPSRNLSPGQQQTKASAVRARRGKSAGDIRYCGRPCDACSLQKLQQWAKREENVKSATGEATAGQHHSAPGGSPGGGHFADVAPVTRVSLPGRGLPKLTGLQHELDDPSYYDRQGQDSTATNSHPYPHKAGSRQDSRPAPQGPRAVSVVRDRAMLRHVRLGSELLNTRYNGDVNVDVDVLNNQDCQGLLETILVFEIPGVSKMKNNYSGLLDRPGGDNYAHRAGQSIPGGSTATGCSAKEVEGEEEEEEQDNPPLSSLPPTRLFPSFVPSHKS